LANQLRVIAMSRLSYNLCVATCLGLGVAIYAHGFLTMPDREASPAIKDTPPPLPTAKPRPKTATAATAPTATGSIKPQASAQRLPKIPGVHFASLDTQALPAPETERWTPAIGYNPVVAPPKQAQPATVKRPRKARAGRYYRRPNFGVVIGLGPRFYW
jgi:hypothetical protein